MDALRRRSLGLAITTIAVLVGIGTAAAAKPAERAKLRVTELGSPPAWAEVGDSFAISGEVSNAGERRGRGQVKVWLDGFVVATDRIRVKPGRDAAFAATATIPSSLDPGPGGSRGPLRLNACVRKRGNGGPPRCRRSSGSITIAGAAARGLTIDPGARDFGTWFVGDGVTERSLAITSIGLDPVTVSSIELTGPDAGEFTLSDAGSCERALAPGTSCVVDVGFDPSTDGAKSAELRVLSDAASGSVTSALSGKAVTGAPGARTTGDPLFPQVGNGGYDATHYEIALDYDPASNTFADGTSTAIDAVATQDLTELSLDFQDLAVSEVLVDGEPAQFEQVTTSPPLSSIAEVTQPMKLVVTPALGIPEGEAFTVEVAYSGSPEEITDADESIEGWIQACYTPTGGSQTCDGAFVVNEPNGAQSWFPSNNVPADKATVDTTITVPSGKTAFGTGEVDGDPVDNGDGTVTWSWTEDDPTATYLTTATVGDFDYTVQTDYDVPIYRAFDSSASLVQETAINESFDLIPTQMDELAGWYGTYPFDSTGGVADRTTGVGYALEVQTKPHYATLSVSSSTQLHELAHQWFGDSVSPAFWNEIWFNEGWAVFSEWYSDGSANAIAQFTALYNNPTTDWSIAPRELNDDPAELFNGTAVYDRPGATVEGYREIVGDDRFFAFAKAIAEEFEHSTIDYDAFVSRAVEFSGLTGDEADLLTDYFDEWLNGTTKPTITPDSF